jgi:hypothetical protein
MDFDSTCPCGVDFIISGFNDIFLALKTQSCSLLLVELVWDGLSGDYTNIVEVYLRRCLPTELDIILSMFSGVVLDVSRVPSYYRRDIHNVAKHKRHNRTRPKYNMW